MKVSTLITNKKVVTISKNQSVAELIEVLGEFNFGALVVSEDGKSIQGIVSERDIVRKLNEKVSLDTLKVDDLMTKNVQVCRENDTVAGVMQTMTHGRFRHCPVVNEDGNLVSIVSIGDVVKAYISEITDERDALNSYIQS